MPTTPDARAINAAARAMLQHANESRRQREIREAPAEPRKTWTPFPDDPYATNEEIARYMNMPNSQEAEEDTRGLSAAITMIMGM